MENKKNELEFENKRLNKTISVANERLKQVIQDMEENKSAIISAKQELRENTTHSISSLWDSEGFEALVELSQYANPVINKMATEEALENEITALNKLIISPYFARIDFKFEGEDEFEKIYIGRSSLMEKETYEMMVYDWRSPIASVFYRFVKGAAYYDAPEGRITGEVDLKRQYEIKNGGLVYFFDADIQIVDEFLRKMLSQNTTPKMKAIVETIQKEQDIVIRDMENDLMMVQGVAGSGKTSIALHRVAYLMYQGLAARLPARLTADNIIIISPNPLFEQYISNVLPELGEDSVVSMVFEELAAKTLGMNNIQSRNKFIESILSTSGYRTVIKNSMEFKTSEMFIEILNRFIDDIPRRWINFEDVYYKKNFIVSGEELQERVLSGRDGTPLGIKLQQLEGFIFDSIHEFKGKPLSEFEEAIVRKEIQKFTKVNVNSLYRILFNNRKYFKSLSKGLKLPQNIDDIFIFTRDNLNTGYVYYDDAAVLTFLKLRIKRFNEYRNIKQVVIDEAQDYYPIHYEIFNLLFPSAKFTVLGDINQTLEKNEDLSLYTGIEKALNKKKSTLVTMDKSFRCTSEILDFSSKFMPQHTEIKSFNRKGEEPNIYTAENKEQQSDLIASEIKLCIDKGYRSVGLICKTEKSCTQLYEGLKKKTDVKLIDDKNTYGLEGAFIIPVYMSKGLEFDAVLVCDGESYDDEDDRNLLYVACTRALHRLSLFSR